MSMPSKPIVVQHSFGEPGTGGPVGALDRLLSSRLADTYTFVRMHQEHGIGGLNIPLLREWVKLLKQTRPEIVHVRGLGNEGFHAALAARIAQCPKILLSIHGSVRDLNYTSQSLRRTLLVNALEPATLRMATDIVTVCKSMEKRPFLDRVRPKMRAPVPNGVDIPQRISGKSRTAMRSELDIAPDQIVLVSVGRLTVEKGHIELARALSACPEEMLNRIVLLLVGDGPDREMILNAYAATPQLNLRALGRRHDVGQLLQAADIFVFPTLHENLSNALLEAMAAKLPIVATAVGGNVEVLSNGGGVLVPSGNHNALVSALTELINDQALRTRLGEQALATVSDTYSLGHMVDAWDGLYHSLLARPDSR